jgi:hypothetical protein
LLLSNILGVAKMKKFSIFAAITVVLLATLALAGMAFAQTQNPPDPEQPYSGGPGWGPSRGMMSPGSGMMGGRWNRNFSGQNDPENYGPMHEAMISGLAQAFNLTPEDLEARHEAGETMWDLAQDLGLTQEEFQAAMIQARTEGLNQAVADGVISQEQADWMLERMNGMWSGGYGPGAGGCPGMGGRYQVRPGRGGWNQ